ncbi:MAG: hypothetical protein KDD99_19590 [Bacteroidetes bacterium]|nr:hypothetical protein [Bacteroidota bacterium]
MLKRSLNFAILCLILVASFAQSKHESTTLETIINQNINSYAFTEDNKFRLCAYSELKGRYANSIQTLMLNFGSLGYFSFFQKNCLLRAENNRVYSLNRNDFNDPNAVVLNQQLDKMFEKIILLGNAGASREHILFVDRSLAKKNLEPFEKVYLRHILLKYGKYDSVKKEVSFHSNWLPHKTYEAKNSENDRLVQKHVTPLYVKLNESIVRGYYLESGGTVYIENVKRDVYYATGEQYDYNISAFKLFVQKLFVQSIQFIAKKEANRLEDIAEKDGDGGVVTQMVTYDSPIDEPSKYVAGRHRKAYFQNESQSQVRNTITPVKPLYHEYNWIPMMLTIMRTHGINIGDVDVVKYFIDQPYFPRVYELLTKEEKEKVDFYQSQRLNISVAG